MIKLLQENGISKEEYEGTLLFIDNISKEELTFFVCAQQKTVDWLVQNNKLFIKAYHAMEKNITNEKTT